MHRSQEPLSSMRAPSAARSLKRARCDEEKGFREKSQDAREAAAYSPVSSPRTDFESVDSASTRCGSPAPTAATRTLPLEFWEREEACKEMKSEHLRIIDRLMPSRERLIMLTTLWKTDVAMEPNMFPYKCPDGIEHWTLWSVRDMSHEEVCEYVEDWLAANYPHVRRWNYDDNLGQRSVELFHVHVYIETKPFSFVPDPEKIYRPVYRFELKDDDDDAGADHGSGRECSSQTDRSRSSKRRRSESQSSAKSRHRRH